MTTFDVRSLSDEPITKITFSEYQDSHNAISLTLEGGYIFINSVSGFVVINKRGDAKNLIKALQKAIELEWGEMI